MTLGDNSEFSDLGEEPHPQRPPLTGWPAAYRITRGVLLALLPATVILGVMIAVHALIGPPKHNWRFLVQRSEEGNWAVVGEYADEGACLQEARARNKPTAALQFACYSKDESPDAEEPIEKLLEREGYR